MNWVDNARIVCFEGIRILSAITLASSWQFSMAMRYGACTVQRFTCLWMSTSAASERV